MKVREIMTTDIITLAPDTPVLEIARTFRNLGITGAPVLENGLLIGIVTQIDLIARHARPNSPVYLPLLDARIPLGGQHEYQEAVRRITGRVARDLMTSPVKVIDADADLEEAATLMVESKANPIPVVEGGRLVGIITHADIVGIITHADIPGIMDGPSPESEGPSPHPAA